MENENWTKVDRCLDEVVVEVADGRGAKVKIEPIKDAEPDHWMVSLCIDFTPVHPKESLLRVYLTRKEANDIAMALINAVSGALIPNFPVKKP